MRNNVPSPTAPWLWTALHFTLGLLVPAVFFALIGCIEKPEVKPASLGNEVSEEEIDDKITEALKGLNPYKITENQYAFFEKNYRVENSEVVHEQDILRQVKGIIDNEERFTVFYNEVVTSYKNDKPSQGTPAENKLDFAPKTSKSSVALRSLSADPFSWAQSVFSNAFQQLSENVQPAQNSYIRATFHDLKVSRLNVSPPLAVRQREDCGGVPDCTLRVRRIEYNVALWYSDSEYDWFQLQSDYSVDAPYLATIVSDCLAQQPLIEKRDYYIRTCTLLRDFHY